MILWYKNDEDYYNLLYNLLKDSLLWDVPVLVSAPAQAVRAQITANVALAL